MNAKTRQGEPCYQQLANLLRARIVREHGATPFLLPSEFELAKRHGLSRNTIRRALHVLADEGLVRRTAGLGTVTVPDGVQMWRRLARTRSIAIITRSHTLAARVGSFYWQVFQGIVSEAKRLGYAVSTRFLEAAFIDARDVYRPEDEASIIGVALVGIYDDRIIAMHTQAGYPVVSVDYWTTDPRADVAVCDCFGAGYVATEFLMSQGHRNIFYLGHEYGAGKYRRPEPDAELMLAGCRQVLGVSGLTLPDRNVHFCHDEVDRVVRWFKSLSPRPTAGVIFDYSSFRRFRDMLGQAGIACPDDLSLVTKVYTGEDSNVAATRADPSGLGRTAVELLLQRASGRQHALRTALPFTLQRGTTVSRRIR